MKKIMLAILPLLMTGAGFAQSGQPDFDLRKKACPTVAQQAGSAYTAKHENGKPYQLSEELRGSMLLPLYMWSVNYAENQATGIDDAVHTAVEKCLRNVERVASDAREGKKTRVEDLQ